MLTIPEFTSLTQQQIFDIAARHILSTKRKSMACKSQDNGPTCCYSGSGCNAAPFLLPEHRQEADYATDNSWHGLVHYELVPDHERAFMSSLQRAHDDCSNDLFMVDYLSNMRDLALLFNLNTDALA